MSVERAHTEPPIPSRYGNNIGAQKNKARNSATNHTITHVLILLIGL